VGWPRRNPVATAVIVGFLVVGCLIAAARVMLVNPLELAVGDCLFVRTAAAQDETAPIGGPSVVTAALFEGRAERTSCNASHGHEVSAVVDLRTLDYPLPETRARCVEAFQPYVGRAAGGSIYMTFAALATPEQQQAGAYLGICLVARADGSWVDHAARGSGK
jgi:hypothetical protein